MRLLVVDLWETEQPKNEDNRVSDRTEVETPPPSDGVSEDTPEHESE